MLYSATDGIGSRKKDHGKPPEGSGYMLAVPPDELSFHRIHPCIRHKGRADTDAEHRALVMEE